MKKAADTYAVCFLLHFKAVVLKPIHGINLMWWLRSVSVKRIVIGTALMKTIVREEKILPELTAVLFKEPELLSI